MIIGLHKGLALSPHLFGLIMDGLTIHIQEEVPWYMFFKNDIILVDESKDGVNAKLDGLESKGD